MLSPVEADNLLMLPGIRHGFFTRPGGVSTGLYAGLNCGQGSKDDPVAVIENRQRVAEHLGSSLGDIQTVYQIHGADVALVETLTGREALPKADAVVTKTRGLAVGILTADCGPVLFADAEAKVVAAAHAGWRGALAGVLEATVDAMEGVGARRDRIVAALGPTIGAGSYEVGEDFRDAFLARDGSHAVFFNHVRGEEKPRFDLPAFVGARLASLGLKSIEVQSPCTYRNESMFFSYRRATHRSEPDYGRQISAIVVS